MKDFSNENLIKIIRDMMYDLSILYLKVDINLEEDPNIDDDFSHVLHYNFNILGDAIGGFCPQRETMNISFSYHDINEPDTNYYDTKGGYYFFHDPHLLYSRSDINKKMLLKKYALLSFIYEYRYDINLNEKTSDIIYDKIKRLRSYIYFLFFKNKEDIDFGPYTEKVDELSGKAKNSIQYSSHFTIFNFRTYKKEKIKPKSEAEIKIKI